MGMKSTGGGEIVQVQGGHIVRSTGRKDRHSKVYTSKGPRDRRVRLSAYTAIQFYDVQDRLGYDRPSKAVDWLINKAQSAIDKLAELPPWHPEGVPGGPAPEQSPEMAIPEQSESSGGGGGGGYNFNLHGLNESSTSLAFFPTSSSGSSINFQSFSVPEMALAPRTANQDLCLSLHSFHDHHAPSPTDQMSLFGDAGFQRMGSWGGSPPHGRGGGFMFGSPPPPATQPVMFREPLQSSFAPPPVRSWDDIPMADRRFGLPEFCLPPQIHGGDDGGGPSPASPSSHH